MSKLCIVCREQEAVSAKRCKACKDAISLGGSPFAANHKWRVPIQVCKQGHSHVPVNGECLKCNPAAGIPRKCAQCKMVTVTGKSTFCGKKCAHTHHISQLTDNYCVNCGKQLTVVQEKVCSLKCNGQYKKKKIEEVIKSLNL